MDSSPRGHRIRKVAGNPSGIIERGRAITTLGEQMLESAEVLQRIKDNSLGDNGQRGKAIEALRESIGESHEKLKEAGDLYSPVGPVITAYGDALFELKPTISTIVDDCEDLWTHFQSLPGSNEPPAFGDSVTGPEAGSPEAVQQAADDADKRAAYDAWEERAEDFDVYYEDWEDAFDTAVDGIGNEMSGKIKDGWWDNWGSDLFEVLNTVLSIAGLIIGIIAIFTGGWVVLLIVSAAALVVTAVRYAHDEASGFELALSIVGVIPFGKIASVLAPARILAPADEIIDAGTTATRSGPLVNNLMRLTSGSSADDFIRLMRGMEGLDLGRQLLVSQIVVGMKVGHLGNLYQWATTPSSVPGGFDSGVDLYRHVTEGDQHDA